MPAKIRAIGVGLKEAAAALAPIVAGQQCLSDVVAWLAASGGQRQIADVVVQDEYTHDVVVRQADVVVRQANDIYLVYDVT